MGSALGARKSGCHLWNRIKDTTCIQTIIPKAAANPVEIHLYPLDALPAFRRWLQNEYFPTKFPNYIQSKVSKGSLPPIKGDSDYPRFATEVVGSSFTGARKGKYRVASAKDRPHLGNCLA